MTDAEADKAILAAKEDCWAFGKTTLDDMIDAVQFCAYHFECEQRVRLLAGSRVAPDMVYMQHVVRLDDVAKLLMAMRDRPRDVARRLERAKSP